MLCSTCAYNYDLKHCARPEFGEVVRCSGYISKANYKYPSYRRCYIIPYNFPLNTRKGFNAIYHLTRLTQYDMASVIMIIIRARHKSIDVILNACKKIEEENVDILSSSTGELNNSL